MGWLGKAIGGTIGFAIGGPIGAIAGGVFGHAFDKNSEMEYNRSPRPGFLSHEASQSTFFIAAFSMLAKLTAVDGHVNSNEIASIERFMDRELKLSPLSRDVAINIFNAAMDADASFQDYARQFNTEFRNRPQILDYMLDILLRVSSADGVITPAEEIMLTDASRIFGIPESEYRKMRGRYVRNATPHYGVLKCSETDSDEKIKQQYRKLVKEYHPDKISSKGLPEEFVQFANDKFREIQEAYEAIQRERGFR